MRLFAFGLATSAAVLLTGAQAFAATVMFDDFSADQLAVDAPYVGSTSSNFVNFNSGRRTLTAKNTANNGNEFGATTLGVSEGALSFSNNDKATGTGTLSYSNVGDISNGSNPFFFFDVGTFDNVANFSVEATDTDNNISTYSEVLQAGFSPTLFFSQFTGSADFNSLSTLSFMIDTTNVPGFGSVPRVDGSLNSISISAVPLPATGLLLLAGFGGLTALRRKTRA